MICALYHEIRLIALQLQKMYLKIIIFKGPFILVFNNLKYMLERRKNVKIRLVRG